MLFQPIRARVIWKLYYYTGKNTDNWAWNAWNIFKVPRPPVTVLCNILKNAKKRQLRRESVVLFCFIQATQELVLLANMCMHNLRIISLLRLKMYNCKIVDKIPPCKIITSAKTITFLVESRLSKIVLMVNAAKIPHQIYKSFKQFYLGYFHFIKRSLRSIW